jgi:hypothetical protein
MDEADLVTLIEGGKQMCVPFSLHFEFRSDGPLQIGDQGSL